MGKVVKKIKKIIPKEIRPALPAIAAIAGPQFLASYAGSGGALGAIGTLAKSNPALAASLLSAGTQGITEGKIDPKQAALAGLQSYAGGKLTAMGTGAKAGSFADFLGKTGKYLKPDLSGGFTFENVKAVGKAAIPETSYAVAQDVIEMNEKALRDYEAQLREQGIMDSAERRNAIFGYFSNAGYSDSEINSMLDKYGYAYGGRVGYKKGGEIGIESLYRGPMTAATRRVVNRIEGAVPNEDDENYEDDDGFKIYPKGTTSTYDLNLDAFKDEDEDEEKLARALKRSNYDLSKGLQSAVSGLEMAFGRPIDMRPERTRFGLADGGIMNLGGREMDMRGGGFIPIGSRERADDVPARLSKNEFVMTADAVRAAGGGNINKGAKRMYDLMNKLEAKS